MRRLLIRIVRWLAEALVRLYYPARAVEGAERIPTGAPLVFVLNHPNGLLDPLLLAGRVTLEVCVLIGMPLNFANIIALPLLLGVGVAFKIYYIMAWRSGERNFLQSSLTRAVIYSACTCLLYTSDAADD